MQYDGEGTGNDIRASDAARLMASPSPEFSLFKVLLLFQPGGPTPAGGKDWTLEWEVTFAGSLRKWCVLGPEH